MEWVWKVIAQRALESPYPYPIALWRCCVDFLRLVVTWVLLDSVSSWTYAPLLRRALSSSALVRASSSEGADRGARREREEAPGLLPFLEARNSHAASHDGEARGRAVYALVHRSPGPRCPKRTPTQCHLGGAPPLPTAQDELLKLPCVTRAYVSLALATSGACTLEVIMDTWHATWIHGALVSSFMQVQPGGHTRDHTVLAGGRQGCGWSCDGGREC